VSNLYIDPASGVIIRNAFKHEATSMTDFSLFHMISHTPDMGPILRPYSNEIDELAVFTEQHRDEFVTSIPEEWRDSVIYEQFLGEVKTAMVLQSWVDEVSEDQIIERYRSQPGDLYRTIENAKWLLHATHELATLFKDPEIIPLTRELEIRIDKGVKKELLPIVKLEGIGRVRGRILFNAGLRTVADLKKAELAELANLPLIGPRLAKKIKEQVGGFVKKDAWESLEREDEWKQRALTEY